MSITVLTLIMASAAFIIYEKVSFKKQIARELTIFAKVVGNNSSGAIDFRDLDTAEEILSTLVVKKNIVSAVIYQESNEVLARYHRDLERFRTPVIEEDGVQFKDNHLAVFETIKLDGERVGTLYLKSDLEELKARLSRLGLIVAVTIVVASIVAFLLITRLQRLISRPVLHLVETARRVSEEKNYSIRANPYYEDEIGLLISQFNEMLDQIQSRDNETRDFNRLLEARVKERTKALQIEIDMRGQAETELRAFTERLKQSNRELQDFAYICSHDLQEPLRKIIAFGDRLQNKFSDEIGDQGKEYLGRMQGAAQRMRTLIINLLDFSRVTTHGNSFKNVNLSKISQEVLSDLEIPIENKGAHVSVEKLATIDADPVQMRQLFQNVIGNALKFSKKDVPPVITILGRILEDKENGNQSEGIYQISIKDNGIGFDQKYSDRIFGVFQRLHGRTDFEGTGIGLAVCRKITERHGGNIIAKSVLGEGTEFVIQLPLKHQEEGEQDGKQDTGNHDTNGG